MYDVDALLYTHIGSTAEKTKSGQVAAIRLLWPTRLTSVEYHYLDPEKYRQEKYENLPGRPA